MTKARRLLARVGGLLPAPAYDEIRYRILRLREGLRFDHLERRVRAGFRDIDAASTLAFGPERVDAEPEDVVGIVVVRNGEEYIHSFLDHHDRLGIRHLFVLDNGSTDRTLDRLRRSCRVTVVRCTLPFSRYGFIFRRYLIDRFVERSWALFLDIDEHFAYPYSNEIGLRDLVQYLAGQGYSAMAAQMLDMLPEEDLPEAESLGTGSLLDFFPFYDASAIEMRPYPSRDPRLSHCSRPEDPRIQLMYGGVRKSAFGSEILLTKHPLFRPADGVRLRLLHFVDGARIADISGVLLHFKFTSSLRHRVRHAIETGAYFGQSRFYRDFEKGLDDLALARLRSESARRLDSVEQLVREGLVMSSPDWEAFVKSRAC